MNLYIFKESSCATEYGIGTYIRELTNALRHSNINVCVICLESDKPQIQIEENDGVRFWYFPCIISKQRTTDFKRQRILYYRNIVYLLKLHIKRQEDLIFNLNHNHSANLAEDLKNAFNCKIVTTVHYLDWYLRLSGNLTRFRQILTKQKTDQGNELLQDIIHESYLKEKEFFASVDYIISLSECTQQILQEDYKIESDKILVIYNGLTDNKSVPNKFVLKQKYHIPDIPIILFVGRLDEIKGLKYALRAFKIVLEKQPNCHFIIAGNGTFDIYMKECVDIWMNVAFTGMIEKEKLYDLYSIADVGVIPSLFETFGYVAVEMMMHGLPVVATATSGLNEVVDDTCGLKIPLTTLPDKVEIDTTLLAQKILYLLQHPAEAQQMGQEGRKRFLNEYSSEVFRKNMLNFYNTLFEPMIHDNSKEKEESSTPDILGYPPMENDQNFLDKSQILLKS